MIVDITASFDLLVFPFIQFFRKMLFPPLSRDLHPFNMFSKMYAEQNKGKTITPRILRDEYNEAKKHPGFLNYLTLWYETYLIDKAASQSVSDRQREIENFFASTVATVSTYQRVSTLTDYFSG